MFDHERQMAKADWAELRAVLPATVASHMEPVVFDPLLPEDMLPKIWL